MIVEFIETTSSTNDSVKAINKDMYIVYCDYQTKGRGQRGNSWESEAKKNLTFSLSITPKNIAAEKQFTISKIVSISIADTLKEFGIDATIKWPNDIYVGDQKIAGILIENTLSSKGLLSRSIIGVGLNLNQTEFKSDAPNPISMKMIKTNEFCREEVLSVFSEKFTFYYSLLLDCESIDKKYLERLYKKGVQSTYRDVDGDFLGEIIGIGECGELAIKKSTGEIKRYLFKEVSFRL